MRICDRYTVLRDGRQVGGGMVADTNDRRHHPADGRTRGRRALRPSRRRRKPATSRSRWRACRAAARRRTRTPRCSTTSRWRCGAARSSASPAWSAPDAPRLARADLRRRPVRFRPRLDRRPASRHPLAAGRHPPRRRPGARGPQAAGAVPRARRCATNLSMAAHDRILRWRHLHRRGGGARAGRDDYRKALNIRMASQDQIIANLSGGNQQKVVLARWLALRPKVLIVDEPTRGIDVGAKVEVHNLLLRDGAERHRDHRHFVGTAGGAGDQRSHRDDARGPGHRRDRPRKRQSRSG